jgi:hypothetical protein
METTAATSVAERPSAAAGPSLSADEAADFVARFRAQLGLPQKPEGYASNFVIDSPVLECLHVLRIEFDDIFLELEKAGEGKSGETKKLVGA